MKIRAFQLTREARPILSQETFDVERPSCLGYNIVQDGDFVIMTTPKNGEFIIPLSSVSWLIPGEPVSTDLWSQSLESVKPKAKTNGKPKEAKGSRKRGRPRKVDVLAANASN